jgi:hypothetical protein
MSNIEYSWKINSLNKKNTELHNDVIYNVVWTRSGLDLETNIATSVTSNLQLEIPIESEVFVPYSNLSENIIIEWILSKIDIEKVEENIQKQIEYNKSLVVESQFPWNS